MAVWMTLSKAATRLDVNKRTILRWHQAGKLSASALMQTPTGRWLVDINKVPGLK
jgi:predicted site-specific integrase-resolvase